MGRLITPITVEYIKKIIREVHADIIPIDHPDGSITTEKISDNAVTTAKISLGAVTTDRIADSSITLPKLKYKKRIVYGSGVSEGVWVRFLTVTPSPGYKIIEFRVAVHGVFKTPGTSYYSGYRIIVTYSDGSTFTRERLFNVNTTIPSTDPEITFDYIWASKNPAPYITEIGVEVLGPSSYYPGTAYASVTVYEVGE